MLWIRHFLPFITRAHRWMYLASRGWLGGWLPGMRFLLLGHVGRRSGTAYLTPILYVADGDRFILAGSNAGQDRPPAWWLNLQARPEATVQAGRRRLAVKATTARAEEAERLWALLLGSYRWFDSYREATDREIPIVILEPI
ncbi:MAG: nitroreductase family deazaflavin-dependent oxidoreductase [bacterium]|nr:nitroreductase family deazaflavin-dependent oxidoreductase [bacterium]